MLGSSWHITTIWGIPIKIHWSFSLMILYILFIGYKESMDAIGMAGFSFFVLLLFVCVLLHELGHSLTAERFGVGTKDIIISPIGGMARLERLPNRPIHEFWVAIMGPTVNVVIAFVLAIIIYACNLPFLPMGTPATFFNDWENMPALLMGINIGLVIFNLIPAFPMDGGRVLRALLAMRIHRLQATRIASVLGQSLAVAFIVFGMYQGEYILPFIGAFVFFTATAEYRSVKHYTRAERTKAADIARPFQPLSPEDQMEVVYHRYLANNERYFLVADREGQMIGTLPKIILEQGIQQALPLANTAQYLIPGVEYVSHRASVHEIIDVMNSTNRSILLVVKNTEVIGCVDRDIIQEFLYG